MRNPLVVESQDENNIQLYWSKVRKCPNLLAKERSTSSSSEHGSKKPRAKIKRGKINKKINTRFRIEQIQRKTMEDIQERISRLSGGQISKGVFQGILGERKNRDFPERDFFQEKDFREKRYFFPLLEVFY